MKQDELFDEIVRDQFDPGWNGRAEYSPRQLRDRAVEQVDHHADQRWKRAALEATRRLATLLDEITTDEIWGVLDGLDVETHEPRAMGAVIQTASRRGWISKTGRVRQSERPECHARDIAIWKSNIRKDRP